VSDGRARRRVGGIAAPFVTGAVEPGARVITDARRMIQHYWNHRIRPMQRCLAQPGLTGDFPPRFPYYVGTARTSFESAGA
jgi:hypothetical protein